MMPALHQNLRAAERDGFLDLFVDLVMSDHVGVVVARDAVERAELAIDVADVGIVDVAVNDIGDDLVPAALIRIGAGDLAAAVRQRGQFFERHAIQPQRVGLIDALTIPDSLQQHLE